MNELPSFLQQTGPAAYTLTLSASAAETHDLCAAKYAWSRVTGIEAAALRAGQNYGKGFHLLDAAYYTARRTGAPFDAAAIVDAHFAANPQPLTRPNGKPEQRTAARLLQAWNAYRAFYPADDFEVLGVEEPFNVELGSFTARAAGMDDAVTVTARFRGLRDKRVRWHNQLWVFDTKTSEEWKDLTIDEGKASFQFQGYAWVERSLGCTTTPLPTGGVIGDYVISREPYREGRKATPRDLPRDQFMRQPYPYSDATLGEWHADAIGIAREVWDHWRNEEWPRRRGACAHWGKCEYYRLCWETDPDYRLSAAMGADYRPRTPSPLDEDAGKERK